MQPDEIHGLIADVFGPAFFVDPRLNPTEGNGVTVTGTVGVNDLRGGGGKGQHKGKDIGAGVGMDVVGELTNVSVEVAPPPPPQEEVLTNVSVEVAPPLRRGMTRRAPAARRATAPSGSASRV